MLSIFSAIGVGAGFALGYGLVSPAANYIGGRIADGVQVADKAICDSLFNYKLKDSVDRIQAATAPLSPMAIHAAG